MIVPINNQQQKPRSCPDCDRVFVTRQGLADHRRSVHSVGTVRGLGNRVVLQKQSRRAKRTVDLTAFVPESTVRGRDLGAISRGVMPLEVTKEAEEWAVRALSPCDERLEDGRKIPDAAATASAVITSRILTTIVPPSGATMWNLLVASLPVPDVAFIYKTWDPKTTTAEQVTWTAVKYRDYGYGVIATPLGVTANDHYTYISKLGLLSTAAEQVRQTQKGHTFSLNASALNDQGMVLIGQYGSKMVIEGDYVITADKGSAAGTVPAVQNTGRVILATDLPNTTDEVFSKDPRAVRQNARLGAYLPLKLNDPVTIYSPVEENQYYSQDGATLVNYPSAGPIPIVVQYGDGNGGTYQSFINDKSYDATHGFAVASTGLTNMQTGIVIFEGLSVSASIDVKTVAAIEVVPTGDSPWSGNATEASVDDEFVQKQVHAVQRRMASGYPASYNFLGTLLAMVLPALGSVATQVVKGLYSRYVRPRLTASNGQNNLRQSVRVESQGYVEPSLD